MFCCHCYDLFNLMHSFRARYTLKLKSCGTTRRCGIPSLRNTIVMDKLLVQLRKKLPPPPCSFLVRFRRRTVLCCDLGGLSILRRRLCSLLLFVLGLHGRRFWLLRSLFLLQQRLLQSGVFRTQSVEFTGWNEEPKTRGKGGGGGSARGGLLFCSMRSATAAAKKWHMGWFRLTLRFHSAASCRNLSEAVLLACSSSAKIIS